MGGGGELTAGGGEEEEGAAAPGRNQAQAAGWRDLTQQVQQFENIIILLKCYTRE